MMAVHGNHRFPYLFPECKEIVSESIGMKSRRVVSLSSDLKEYAFVDNNQRTVIWCVFNIIRICESILQSYDQNVVERVLTDMFRICPKDDADER